MKKIVLFSMLLIASNASWAQSLPNGDFELWNTTSYSNPDSGWYTSNIQSLTAEDSLTVWKVPGMTGQAMHIQTAIVGSDTLMAYITNSIGDPTKGQGGMPYGQKPTALSGFYKCNVKVGDTAVIIVVFKKAGVIIAPPFRLAITGSAATYTAFTIPITLALTPDTVIIAATSSNLLNNNIGLQSGSWLELDQLAFTGIGITQGIVNGSFDSWSSLSFDKVMNWQAQANGQRPSGVNKTTDHYSGNYAIMLQTQPGGGNGGVAQVTTGHMSKNSGPQGGLPYTRMTDTLTGYYKYTTSGTDSGQIFVTLSKSGNPVGGNVYHCVATTTWTYFQIPLSASITPDSIRVDLISSSWTSAVAGSTLYVDKMQLKSQPVGISHVTSAVGLVSTYPNPVEGVLHINTGNTLTGNITLRLFDVNGKVVLQKNYTADNSDIAIPVSQFAKGIYFYELRSNDLIISDKFMKQ